jgi:hypothetical protein
MFFEIDETDITVAIDCHLPVSDRSEKPESSNESKRKKRMARNNVEHWRVGIRF